MSQPIGVLTNSDAAIIRSSALLQSTSQCVAEIVENAIDANATTIHIKVNLLGLSFTVADNGAGINQHTLSLIGKRFHSSKHINRSINQSNDLVLHEQGDETFGCRGEALASLACIACVDIHTTPSIDQSINQLISRTSSSYCNTDDHGNTYSIRLFNQSKNQSINQSGNKSNNQSNNQSNSHTVNRSTSFSSHSGTTVTVTRLFHCLPVRRAQLLQRRSHELDKIKFRIERLALIHPSVSFTLIDSDSNDRVLVRKTCSVSIIDSFSSLFQIDIHNRLISILSSDPIQSSYFKNHKRASYITNFYVSSLYHITHSKQLQFLFLNRRPVKHPSLIKVIERIWLRCHRFIQGQTISDVTESSHVRSNVRSPHASTSQRVQFASHPVILLQLHLPLNAFDCLSDPDKQTCIFEDERNITNLVRNALIAGLLKSYPVLAGKADELFHDKPVDARSDSPSLEVVSCSRRRDSDFAGYVARFAIPDASPPNRHRTSTDMSNDRPSSHRSLHNRSLSRPLDQSTRRTHPDFHVSQQFIASHRPLSSVPSNPTRTRIERIEHLDDDNENDSSLVRQLIVRHHRPYDVRPPASSQYTIEVVSDSEDEQLQLQHDDQHEVISDAADEISSSCLRFLPASVLCQLSASDDDSSLRFIKKRKLIDAPVDQAGSTALVTTDQLTEEFDVNNSISALIDQDLAPVDQITCHSCNEHNDMTLPDNTSKLLESDQIVVQSAPSSHSHVVALRDVPPLVSYRYQQTTPSPPVGTSSLQHIFERWRVGQPNDRTLGAIARDGYEDGLESLEHVVQTQMQVSIAKSQLSRMHVIGQCDKKFILVHVDGMIVALDQHAADERVRLEALQRQLPTLVHSRSINPPWVLSITSSELAVVHAYPDELRRWGWQVVVYPYSTSANSESTSMHNLIVHVLAVPQMGHSSLNENDLHEFLSQLAERAPSTHSNNQSINQPINQSVEHSLDQSDWTFATRPRAIDRLLASRSCRYAVMFNDTLNHQTMCDVVNGVSQCALPFQCAHGRPTISVLAQLKRTTNSPMCVVLPWEAKLAAELSSITMNESDMFPGNVNDQNSQQNSLLPQ